MYVIANVSAIIHGATHLDKQVASDYCHENVMRGGGCRSGSVANSESSQTGGYQTRGRAHLDQSIM